MAHTKWEPALGTTSGSQRADVIERLYILYVGVRDVREPLESDASPIGVAYLTLHFSRSTRGYSRLAVFMSVL